jgi:hypothetical protein
LGSSRFINAFEALTQKATGLNRGLLVNFGEKQLVNGIKRISL